MRNECFTLDFLPPFHFTYGKATAIVCNADMRIGEIRKFCLLQNEGQSLICSAMNQLQLSTRAYHRTRSVKLARTIADLAGSEKRSNPRTWLRHCILVMYLFKLRRVNFDLKFNGFLVPA